MQGDALRNECSVLCGGRRGNTFGFGQLFFSQSGSREQDQGYNEVKEFFVHECATSFVEFVQQSYLRIR
jgi:hypothetical protein